MSFNRPTRTPRFPAPPQGEVVGRYGTYPQAQRAVAHLAAHEFPVELVSIVGTDLKTVERVTGRLSYPRAAVGGFMSGAWFGLFVGLLLTFFAEKGTESPVLPAILIGGAFGLMFSVISYSISRRWRGYTSSSQIVATSYAVLCAIEQAHRARAMLREGGVGGDLSLDPAAMPVAPPPEQIPPTAPPVPPTQPPPPPES